jgi:hypothetical protein
MRAICSFLQLTPIFSFYFARFADAHFLSLAVIDYFRHITPSRYASPLMPIRHAAFIRQPFSFDVTPFASSFRHYFSFHSPIISPPS